MLGSCRDGGDKVLGPRARSLDVLGTNFEDIFEIGCYVGDFVLQHQDDILVMLAFLIGRAWVGGGGMAGLGQLLQGRDLGVESGKVLFDDIGEFGDLDRSVVKDCFSFGDWQGHLVAKIEGGLKDQSTYAVPTVRVCPW